MNNCVLTVTLNPAIDKTLTVSNFKTGKDFREEAIFISAGGKGINISQILNSLKIKSIATGFLGGHNGNFIKENLIKNKINADFCIIKGNSRISHTIINPSTKIITRILERGPKITTKDLSNFKKKYLNLLKKSDYVVLSGRNVPGAPDNFYSNLISYAKKRQKITILDTSGHPYDIALKNKPFIIKPNLKEAEQIIGKKLNSLQKKLEAIYYFHNLGVKIVILTIGSKGALASNGNKIIFAIPPKIIRKSPVGCGDSFIAGFIAYHKNNKSFEDCVKMGISCGTANALNIYPGIIKLSDIKKIFSQIKIKNI
ncbi:MAG: 1-phosphofructokinase family hexose kinase [Candidatus Omnitrophica bacterium]|nr:1-phosphofructokinase family hexose kinase [Candidatus Omnitrophota bacterium]MCK5392740.1 1-phosphofructokinase family hexose kinase [Candidatus Omnitrophota bacterium]